MEMRGKRQSTGHIQEKTYNYRTKVGSRYPFLASTKFSCRFDGNHRKINVHPKDMKRILTHFNGYQRMPKIDIRFSCVCLIRRSVTGP